MKNYILLLLLSLAGCYAPNDPPKAEFSFGFKGRLEKLEDVFYSLQLNYKEKDFSLHMQKTPEYDFTIVRHDTIINYTATLLDCQSIYYLVEFEDDWKCDSSYIHIDKFMSNIDSLSTSIIKSIFKEEIIDRITEKVNTIQTSYHWKIETRPDTVLVKIVNQNSQLRKQYIYSFDSIMNDIAEKTIVNYLGDSTIIYQKSKEQRFVYLKSKEVIYNKR